MEFSMRPAAKQKSASEGAEFLSRAKKEHESMMRELLAKADSYSSVETYTDAIEMASWDFASAMAAASGSHSGSPRAVGRGPTGCAAVGCERGYGLLTSAATAA